MKILCGYNVNIDSVYRISGAEVSELLESFDRTEILEKTKNPPGKILSESDFAAGLAYCMKNGCGAEWLVFDKSVFEFLKNHYFEKSLVRMGGNAGIMANALSQLGATRVIPNVAVPSKTQLSLFSKKAIYIPDSHIVKDVASSSQDPVHFVFDFSEGDTFSLYGTEIRAPRENRFIATCDHLNFKLFVNPAFEEYALQHACEIDGVLISGFHLLLENYSDGSSYKTILENALSQLRSWKVKNDKLRIHLEFGHFASRKIANSVFEDFAAISYSIGMNEDELAMLHHLHGIPTEGLLRMEADAVGNAACRLALRNGLKKLLIHTREFVMTIYKPDSNFDDSILREIAEKKLEAMEFGVSCAGAYAASGRLEGRKFAEEEASKLQESTLGRTQLELFLKAFNGKVFGHGAYAFREGYILCILPTLLSKSPLTTVGLGDTLTAGTFLRELELDVQA
ncbi:MAG: ADP-dependent glucokinase/phosphofructokinase [Methanosarcina sp.]|uniref:ADP-dependent glucokinase/phosphofructokinase n=1 Tax=Methanosarcina sp. TaxID=2213 RepID=UPI003BB6A40C